MENAATSRNDRTPIPPQALQELVGRLVTQLTHDGTVGIALIGSYARGDAGPYSDVDIDHYVDQLPTAGPRSTLCVDDGHLVNVSLTTLAEERMALQRPHLAVSAVPALQQMRILFDPHAQLRQLRDETIAFVWEPLQAQAAAYGSHLLAATAEDVFKLLNALSRADPLGTVQPIIWIVDQLTRAVAVSHGIMIPAKGQYYLTVQETMGSTSEWTRLHRRALGLEAPGPDGPHFGSGAAALALYRTTARLLEHQVTAEDRPVVAAALAALDD